MASTNYRTWQKHRVAHLLITVHLEPLADPHSLTHDKGLAHVTRQLIALMDKHRLPTTWAVSDPAYSAATALVLRSEVDHELAILGDANWVGPTAGRTRFARELSRRVSQARGAGIEVKALVPRVACVKRHIDLVIKQRITAVAGIEAPATSGPLPVPRAVHYGVWELPTCGVFPKRGSNWLFTGGWSTWRHIRRAAGFAGTYHLMVDAPALLQEGRRTEKAVARLMQRIAELRNRGLVCVETLGRAAARLADVPVPSPQRSILRRAA